MRARMKKIAGLLLVGTLAFTVAYTERTEAKKTVTANIGVHAGVASEFGVDLDSDVKEDTTVVSGVTGAVADYLSAAANAVPQVAETDVVTTAAGQVWLCESGYRECGWELECSHGPGDGGKSGGEDAQQCRM